MIQIALIITFWVLVIFKITGILTGFLTKRERLSLDVMIDCAGFFINTSAVIISFVKSDYGFFFYFDLVFEYLWTKWLIRDYRLWKKHKDDDDEDHRHRRWSRVKSWLPKPKTKALPQPI